MESLKELVDARLKLVKDNRDLLNRADSERRQLNTEERSEYDKRDADIDKLSNQITERQGDDRRRSKLKDYDAMLADNAGRQVLANLPDAIPQTRDGQHNPIKLAVSGHEIILNPGSRGHTLASQPYVQAFGHYLATGRASEALSLQVSADTKGGYWAPPTFVAMLIKFLDDLVFMRKLCTVLPPMTSAVNIGAPSWDTDPNDADWTVEVPASDISEDTGATVGKREFKPNLLTKFVAVSNKLVRTSVIPIEPFLISRLGYKFGITEEKGFLLGSGAQQPLGVFVASTDGIDTSRDVAASAQTTFTADDLINVKYNVKAAYQAVGSWIMHRLAVKMTRKLKDGNGQYLWAPGISGKEPDTILERPFYMSEYAPSTFTTGQYIALFGDFKTGYWICDSLELEVQRLIEILARQNKIGYIARKETDGAPVLAECFSRLKFA